MTDAAESEPDEAASGPLRHLLALQDEDIHIDQLVHRRRHLPEQQTLDAVNSASSTLAASTLPTRQRRDELALQAEAIEHESAEIATRIATIEARVRSGAASSYRDQEAMAAEVASLAARRGELDDHELELLEETEPLEAVLVEVAERERELDTQRAAATIAVDAATELLDAEILAARARRAPLVGAVPGPLLEEYERIRHRLGGVGIARLIRNTCSGCHLTLAATEIDHLRHGPAGSVGHCEQCGRILVP